MRLKGLLSGAPGTLTPRRAPYRPAPTDHPHNFHETPPREEASRSPTGGRAAAAVAGDKAVAYWLFGCGGFVAGMVFRWWSDTSNKVRPKHDGLEAAGGLPPMNRS